MNNVKRISAVALVSLLVILALFSLMPTVAAAHPATHSPIYIDGNSQFKAANGVVSGSGARNNPYVIADWTINASTANGIEITNTNAYFLIINCAIYGNVSNYGILLNNVTNGEIQGNSLANNTIGICLSYSNNTILSNNICYNNTGVGTGLGILFLSSSNNILTRNTAYNNAAGIGLISSNNTILSNNICYNNTVAGIIFEYCSNNILSNNIWYGNALFGIGLLSCSNTILTRNTAYNNAAGIGLISSNNTILSNNICYNNTEFDIFLESCSNNILIFNTCSNSSYGIYLADGSSQNFVAGNIVKNSGLYDLYQDPSSTGTGNVWIGNQYQTSSPTDLG